MNWHLLFENRPALTLKYLIRLNIAVPKQPDVHHPGSIMEIHICIHPTEKLRQSRISQTDMPHNP